ncbi:hypothetical protein EDD11_006161 [Mortierella claussenii]|nr:hypothetical protein EDD11_006161 [Mortierella claussenii]
MTLTERQDMLLDQACRTYHFASLSLDDIFEMVPPPNQLCLITAMMLLSQKPSPEIETKPEPWDPLTLFQRWILRCRVNGVDESGLDFGDSKYHAEALESKLTALQEMTNDTRHQILQCQITFELGQYHCWSGQYEQAIKFLDQCSVIHHIHSATNASDVHLKCRLNETRTDALLKLSKLAIGGLLEDDNESLLSKLRTLERGKNYRSLAQEFLQDNVRRTLPFTWRQAVLHSVLQQSDLESATFIALANATYNLNDPCAMMLEIPSTVLQYLRNITFESGHEPHAYLSPSIFMDLMEFIGKDMESRSSSGDRDKIRAFAAKFCAGVRHVLCYNAAWETGLLDPSAKDWAQVWDMYSFVLLSLPHLTSTLMLLAVGAFACSRSRYREAERYFQAATRFMIQEQDHSSVVFGQVEFQTRKHAAWAQLGILAFEHENRREQRIRARLQQRVSVRLADYAKKKGSGKVTAIASTTPSTCVNENDRMEVDDGTILDTESQERIKKEDQAKEEEALTMEICQLMSFFTRTYGALELNLQLRCLAICINGKHWDFLSGYGRAAAEALDKNVHGEICQVFSVLVPLCAVLGRGQALGVDFKDITSSICLDSLFSSDLEPIQITRAAALDMIQGLLPSVFGRALSNINNNNTGYHSQSQQQPNTNSNKQQQRGGGGGGGGAGGRKPFHEEGPALTVMDEDAGHSAILKLFGWVRQRGVIDVFGALLVGAVSSVLPEGAKLTLSEFGYYALFTTTMDSVGSWTDPRVKIIAMISNGDAGKSLEAVPGAHQRFIKLLVRVFEDQIAFESSALNKKITIESGLLSEERFDDERGLTTSLATSALLATSPKTSASITRYALCLTDLYYLEGKHQDSLASFLYACMVASKCFADFERLDRRVWSAYTHVPAVNVSALSPPLPQAIVPSQNGGPIHNGPPFGPLSETTYPTLSSLSAMTGGPGHPPFGPVPVGLGLSPTLSPSPEAGGIVMMLPMLGPVGPPGPPMFPHGPPGPPGPPGMPVSGPNHLSSLPPSPTPLPLPGMAPIPGGMPAAGGASGLPASPVPSSFALRAIDSCIQLQEPLASVALQQFLPRIDYTHGFAAIRLAYEQGALAFSGKAVVATTATGAPGMLTPVANAASSVAVLTPPTNPGTFGGGPSAAGRGLGVSPALSTGSPRVQSSGSVFTPDLENAGTVSLSRKSSTMAPPGSPAHSSTAAAAQAALVVRRPGGSVLTPQLFLDLVFDMSFLELVSYLYKESKDQQGMLRVQARINSNRMALDVRQPFREQVHHLAQQDLLTRLWSKYARIG